MPRKPRAAAKAAAMSLKATPQDLPDESDAEMADVATPQKDDGREEEEEEDVEEEDVEGDGDGDGDGEGEGDEDGEEDERATPQTPLEHEGTPAGDAESDGGAQDTPSRSSAAGRGSSMGRPRRRRIGRPPKNKPADWDADDNGNSNSNGTGTGDTPGPRSGVNTPIKRGRGRGRPYGGGRWSKSRGGPSHASHMPLDKEGNVLEVIDDEVDLPEDPEGETKVDKMGNLLGGREYRVRIFTILDKGERQYMLSTEPARCIGFRDSYLFFQKHKLLYKIIIDDDAKRDLIEREIIPHSYKGRAIGVVTARSVFREFGAKIIIGGRKIVDDYHAQAAREKGEVEGELAVPEDRLPGAGEKYNKNQYVAWHGASSVYHSGAPSVPMPIGKVVEAKKRKVVVTGDNWMVEHVREASRFNSELASMRRENLNGVYDIHTNMMMYPKTMQPTHARWEAVPPEAASDALCHRIAGTSLSDPEHERELETESTIFPPVPGIFSRNFRIHDIHYESAPNSFNLVPGPDGDTHDLGSNGLISTNEEEDGISFKMTADVLAALPEDCRRAYLEAAAQEWEWKNRWKGEAVDGARANLAMNFAWTP
ncbi:chromatin structure-remodeling complex subunit [Arthroderma uncinatum]|uniref:chromatin structure-remodeling complex subunit n=1 Tax=Arthroderma uncinatum TaxID=74035 RepID=UPI00144AEE76|nr:chromatin structure-remodeling complex subunit [Arthroderma uncinatum]KAF3491495.1 chromatin structure-remodeling complex subunit [Arthroderma uncinatum]